MAEFVEFRAEEWVAELEHLERIRLFEPKEIKTIASKRKQFEYKIQRRTKCKEDYLKYIQFEVNLNRIIKARRKKTGIKIKKAEIDNSQAHRIANLFKLAIFKFRDDVKLWMSFFKFCRDARFHSLVSQMLVRMLQSHSDKPYLWAFAAKWELEECKSIENARQFLTRGLRHHPSCEMLYKQLFSLELNHIKQKQREIERRKEEEGWLPDEVTRRIVEGTVAEIVYKSAVKDIPGLEFKVSLLETAKLLGAPAILYDKMFEDIARLNAQEELAWYVIAQKEFEGQSCDLNELTGEEGKSLGVKRVEERASLRDRILRSVAVYQEAVKKLNTEKMWGLYLDHVLRLNENVRQLPVLRAKVLKGAMEGALASGSMSEEHYLRWIDILRRQGKKNKTLSEVLKKATEHHPYSKPLWYARLRFHLSRDQEKEGTKVFDAAVANLPDSVPIWKLMAKYLVLKSSEGAERVNRVEKVFREGVDRRGEVAQALKPLYLEWVAQTKGMEQARAAFSSGELNVPPCLEMYRKMAALEARASPAGTARVRKCHELAVRDFGEGDAGVWLEYVRFELKDGDSKKVAGIYRRALKSLNREMVDEFVSQFNDVKLELR